MDGQVVFQYQGVEHTVNQLSPKSSSEDVSVWKYRMEMLLEEHDCWEAVSEERCLHWDDKDKTARLLIVKAVSDEMVLLTKGKTAKQMWEALVDKFEKADQPTEVKVETGKGTQDDSQTDRGFEAFLAAGTREEMLREVDKLAEKAKSSPSAADEIGSDEAVMNKLNEKLKETTNGSDKEMYEKIAKLLETITSNLKKDSTARIITQILGSTLMRLAKVLPPGRVRNLLQVLGNLCKHGPAVLLLEPLGIVELFLLGILNPSILSLIAVVGLGLCMKHLPELLRNVEFQKNMKKVAEFCTNVLKKSWEYTCEVVDFATTMLKNITNFCIKKVTEGYHYLREKALEVLHAITEDFKAHRGGVISYIREKIKNALLTFLKYISDFGRSIAKKALEGVLAIVRFVGDSDVIEFVKNNAKRLCKKSLEAVCKVATGANHVLRSLLSWFKVNVVQNVLVTAVVVGGFALAAPIVAVALAAHTVYTAARAVFRFFFW